MSIPTKKVTHLHKGDLKRVLSVKDLFAIGYGDLGSSIYYALGVTAFFALGATPIALTLAGIVFLCTALTYAELSSVYHESGGSASFARYAFNDAISFVAGWGLLLDYVVTIAISSFAVAPYLSYFFPILKASPAVHIGFTLGLIAILYIVNFLGVRESTRMSMILVTMTLATQVGIVIIGFGWLFDPAYVFEHMRIGIANANWSPTWPEFWKGTAMAMVAYTGIESIAQLGAEVKDPSKSVPKAILTVMCVLFFVYIGVSFVALSAIKPVTDLGTKFLDNPVAGIVEQLPLGGAILGPLVGVMAGAILLVAANAGIIGASRLSFKMGEYYQLPRFFHQLHEKRKTPYVAIAFFAFVAAMIILASRGNMAFLADLYNFGAMLAFFSCHLSLIVLRIRKPEMERPFRVPFNIPFPGGVRIPITAIIGTVATFAVWVLVVITKPEGRYLGTAWILLGLVMFYGYRKKKGIETGGQLEVETIEIEGYKPLKLEKILVATRGGKNTESVQVAVEIAKLHPEAVVHIAFFKEIAYTLPWDLKMFREVQAVRALRRAEAIARDNQVKHVEHIVKARSIFDGIKELHNKEKFDLIVVGTGKKKSTLADQLMRYADCRVWVVKTNS